MTRLRLFGSIPHRPGATLGGPGIWVGLLLLAGCASQAPPIASAPPGAARVVTEEFRFDVPTGFSDASADIRDAAQLHAPGAVVALLLASSPAPAAGGAQLRASIAISHIDGGPIPADAVTEYLTNVELAGATDLSEVRPISVGGHDGEAVTYAHTSGSGTTAVGARSEDLVVNSDGISYEIVLDCAASEFAARDAALHDLLASWQWAAPGPAATQSGAASSPTQGL